ncbi:MAG: UDP-N-acetylmuramoyl-tripeptide--D-alanyl-D-alanine ligase [Candidatus Hydrogenedens sp.]|nr:UDP-N-acetylmuramoyl-tripeptide--D-alanyl-D-alanine ligase [Candidatus Hydrogenedens sp.]
MSWKYDLETIAEAVGGVHRGENRKVDGVSTDTRALQPGRLFFALKGENFDANTLLDQAFANGASAVVTSRFDAPGPSIVAADPLVALQRFARWHRSQFEIPVIAITGSCGKTTTKDYIAALLATKYRVVKTQGNLNNDIGVPLSLLRLVPGTEAAVIEMGANHIGEIASLCRMAQPTDSAITMVGAAHIEGFGSIERVAAAKSEIASGLGPNGVFYVNNDDPWCRRVGIQYAGSKVQFGREGDVVLRSCEARPGQDMLLDIEPVGRLSLPLPSPAHASNVVLACAIALRHGVTEFQEPLSEACRQSSRFKVFQLGGLEVIDDTYNANPPSMRAALDALVLRGGGRKMAALGDMFELGDMAESGHAEVGAHAGGHGLSHVFTLGAHAGRMADAARAAGAADARAMESHEAIAEAVLEAAQPGDVLLVKGSRGMKMEKVIEAMRSLLGVPQETQTGH